MTEPVPTTIDLEHAREVTPARAPVGTPLSGKERAGVNLTWGVLALVAIFLVVVIAFLWRQEASVSSALSAARSGAAADTLRFRLLSAERGAFREFWLDMVQMVLVNVLLPVLTALLGYVFGTTQARSSPRE